METTLLSPTLLRLPAFVDALERGWSPDNVRGTDAAREQLREIGQNPARFIGGLDDPNAEAPPVMLPDGTEVKRLPSITRWIWDGEFCGSIGLRWAPGTSALPDYVLGHISFAVVPWKQRRQRQARVDAAFARGEKPRAGVC